MKIIIIACCLFCYCSCRVQNGNPTAYTRTVTDALGRKVSLPDSVTRIVCLRSGAIRLVTYAGGAPLICGVEEQECRPNEFPHTFAHPELAHKPIIGPAMGGDAELILSVKPDLIFMSATTIEDADALQKRTNIPVFALEYGDLHRNRPLFYQSLKQIAQVLHTEAKVDSLLHFIDSQSLNYDNGQIPSRTPPEFTSAASPTGDKKTSPPPTPTTLPLHLSVPTTSPPESTPPTYPLSTGLTSTGNNLLTGTRTSYSLTSAACPSSKKTSTITQN